MRYTSTRNAAHEVGLGEAIMRGLAPDGGLYVPRDLPRIDLHDASDQLPALAAQLLAPFAAGDALAQVLPAVTADAFDFPAPLVTVEHAAGPLSALELFHGPTAAFKDFGARFLAAGVERIAAPDARRLTILVATSGDTGAAVAAAFFGRPGVEVVILYPRGLVSARQEKQLACWGGNVRTFAVRGSFDDCQRLVKAAFADPVLSSQLRLSSANSINVGRLLPQMAYYASASRALHALDGRPANFIVPTGNLGNALACVWARQAGLPIGEIVLATNANLTVTEYFASGHWQPRASVATLASAMDVGDPSNMERLRWLMPRHEQMRGALRAEAVSDMEIRETIRRDFDDYGQVWCPHTATAACVYRRLAPRAASARWVLVATAHPAKFDEIVEPLIGGAVAVPPALARLLSLPSQQSELAPELADLRAALAGAA